MRERPLLVMVSGAYFEPGDFAAHGIVAGWGHAIEARVPQAAYLDGDVSALIVEQIAGRRVWLLGISLGAMGALQTARAAPGLVAGIILLAPFLGTRGLIADIADAGGLAAWQPPPGEAMLAWLRCGLPRNVWLGYGRDDRYAPASALLQALLPPERVIATEGGHDWPTWTKLWNEILRVMPCAG